MSQLQLSENAKRLRKAVNRLVAAEVAKSWIGSFEDEEKRLLIGAELVKARSNFIARLKEVK